MECLLEKFKDLQKKKHKILLVYSFFCIIFVDVNLKRDI